MEILHTENAPKAIGPYSQGIKVGNTIYVSGQLPVNPETGELVNTIEEATAQSIKNAREILKQAGADLNNVVKTTVFLKDINDFAAFNKVYAEAFNGHCPARSCFQVAAIPKDALLEIEMIASLD